MTDKEAWDFWQAIMGDSDNEEGDFEGFTVDDMTKQSESDIDLDLVVNNDHLLAKFESGSDGDFSSEVDGGDGGDDSDVPLPTAVGPTKKKQRRLTKKVRDAVTTHWSDRTHNVKPDVLFAGYKEGAEAVKVGVSHDLPVGAPEYDFLSLLLPGELWQTMSDETKSMLHRGRK